MTRLILRHTAWLLTLTLLVFLAMHTEAVAVPIQIGNAPVATANVDGGTPTNVDQNGPMLLAAGTYQVTDFNSAVITANGSKSLVPFLVTGSPSTYTVVWVGPSFTPSVDGVYDIPYSPLSQTFTLNSPATVYAGANSVIGPLLDFNGGGVTSHNTSPGFGPVITVGQVLTGFSHPTLGRTYSFNLIVEFVPPVAPEPSSLALLGLGLAGVITHRRRLGRSDQVEALTC